MRLLLVNPRFPESFWSFKWAVDTVLSRRRTVTSPLGLATLAALCPADWDIQIVDENVESIPLDPAADVIGVCGMGVQFPRQRELLAFYRSKGYYVVAGGSFASLCPERYESLADTVVAGEAEYISYMPVVVIGELSVGSFIDDAGYQAGCYHIDATSVQMEL